MLVTFIMAFLVQTDPYPTFAFVGEFEKIEQCEKAIEVLEVPAEVKKNFGCLAIAREAI